RSQPWTNGCAEDGACPDRGSGTPFPQRSSHSTHRCGSPGGSHRGLFAIRRPDSRAGSAAGPRLAFESCWEDSLKSHIDHRYYYTNKRPRLSFVEWITRIKADIYIKPEHPTPSPPQEDVETLLTPSRNPIEGNRFVCHVNH